MLANTHFLIGFLQLFKKMLKLLQLAMTRF